MSFLVILVADSSKNLILERAEIIWKDKPRLNHNGENKDLYLNASIFCEAWIQGRGGGKVSTLVRLDDDWGGGVFDDDWGGVFTTAVAPPIEMGWRHQNEIWVLEQEKRFEHLPPSFP